MSEKPVLGYWHLRGLGQPIRLLLAYTGTEFVDKTYSTKEGEKWFDIKFSLGLDFPNLPYFIDGDLKLTQSGAILRHLARKNNLLGRDDEEKALVDMAAYEILDLHMMHSRVMYNPDMEKKKAEHLVNLSKKLDTIEKFLGDKDFIVGSEVTMPDFHLYEILSQLKAFTPETMANYPKIATYLQRFENLPKIKAYMASPDFISFPWNGPSAAWGGK